MHIKLVFFFKCVNWDCIIIFIDYCFFLSLHIATMFCFLVFHGMAVFFLFVSSGLGFLGCVQCFGFSKKDQVLAFSFEHYKAMTQGCSCTDLYRCCELSIAMSGLQKESDIPASTSHLAV